MNLPLCKRTKTVVKTVNAPARYRSSQSIHNNEKDDFFRHGKIPKSRSETDESFRKTKHVKVSLEFMNEAKRILDFVNEKYQSGDRYLDEVFGEPIQQAEATKYFLDYLQLQGLV